MKIKIFILELIAFLFDFILLLFLPFSINHITFIYPMSFIVTNVVLFKYLNKKNFFIYTIFIIIYSAVFLNNIIVGIIIFSIIYFFTKLLIDQSIYWRFIISIIIYDLLFYLILSIFNNYDLTFMDYFYKLSRIIIFNFIYLMIIKLVLKKYEP